MSRVYDALRQSEIDEGGTPTLWDPDTFLSPPPPAVTVINRAAADLGLDEVRTLSRTLREDSRVVTLTETNGLGSEKFRLLRSRLRNMREQRQLQKLVITSAVPDEGKTLVSMNLAVCLSKHTDDRVLLLEGDLRKPTIGERLGMTSLPGLSEWFITDSPANDFIYRFEGLPLWVLPAGAVPENPANILQSPRFLELYKQLSTSFDWIIIDAPPLVPMADVSFWSRHADGLLLVVREGHTPKAVLQKGLETLDNPNVVGVVLNNAQELESAYYGHYYYQLK
jgi:capsular exopolysaccharide synthesis family protein